MATGEKGRRAPELLRLDDQSLAQVVAPKDAGQVLERIGELDATVLRAEVEAAGQWACCRHDPAFPSGLHDAPDAPALLFGRGDPHLLARLRPEDAVTVVGARRAGAYGRDVAEQLGRDLAGAGLTVVSGMAFGIDGAAHRGALDNGLTVAVLGCGADVAYPVNHEKLYREICQRGLVLSELPPGSTPWKWTFPARNRIMAAASGITVVVEAAERSGSLITAEQAIDLNRDVGAVPGPIGSWLSAGTNQLLADGAKVIRDAQDVLDALLGPGVKRLPQEAPVLGPGLAEVLEAIERGCEDRDSIALSLGLPVAHVAAALTELELLGYVSATTDGRSARTALARS